jgi:hypothetical protein
MAAVIKGTNMTPAPPEVISQHVTALRRLVVSGAEVTSRIAIRPVFVDDAGRRRRLLTGFGYLAALACVGYIVVVGISLTAGPTGPLAAMPDPKPPTLVEAMLQPRPVAPTTAAARTTATQKSIQTSIQQPRLVRPVRKAGAPPLRTVVPATTPVTPSLAPTTRAAPTSAPCSGRRCGSTTTTQATDSVTTTPAPTAAAPDPGPTQ